MAVSVLTAIMLALPESALALPSEVPDKTPMVDGRVRAIEQVGTNIWVGGRFTQVKERDGTVLANVSQPGGLRLADGRVPARRAEPRGHGRRGVGHDGVRTGQTPTC